MDSLRLLQLRCVCALGLFCFLLMPPVVQSGANGGEDCVSDVHLPDDFINMTVALHNFYRAHVYPSAANMRKMVQCINNNCYVNQPS